MICREQMDNPNEDGRYSLNGGRDDANPNWCDCRQGECELEPTRNEPGYWCDMCGKSDIDGHAGDCPWRKA